MMTEPRPATRAELPRLHGAWLAAARLAWATWAALVVLLTVVSAVLFAPLLQRPCVGELCAQYNVLLSPECMAVLADLGLTPANYATLILASNALTWMVGWATGLLIFLRRSAEPMALLVALFLMYGGLVSAPYLVIPTAYPALLLPLRVVEYVGWVTFVLTFYLFPQGRFVPRWTRWAALVVLVDEFLFVFGLPIPGLTPDAQAAVDGVIWIATFVLLFGVQLYRYRRIATPAERRQTQWVLFGLASVVLVLLAYVIPVQLVPAWRDSLPGVLRGALVSLIAVVIPLTFGVATLRYRLFDIDVIVRKTLIYGTLSICLGACYVALVVLTQTVVTSVLRGESSLALIGSTLAVAALFQPLRRRVQEVIDRRFYRSRYDAERILTAFAARIQTETDLDRLAGEMVEVVSTTLQPAHVSLWRREPRADAGD
jgi:hypothetical protein